MKMHLYPAPSGAAVKVVIGVRDAAQPRVYVTPTPLDPHAPGTTRAMIGPDTVLLSGHDLYTAAQYGSSVLTWDQALDLDPALQTGPLTYCLFDLAHPTDPPVSLTVDGSQQTVGLSRPSSPGRSVPRPGSAC